LDAVQDLLDHPTFEQEFTQVAKGLPDLERIVSRIHAKNCKVKDFLKVLAVSLDFLLSQRAFIHVKVLLMDRRSRS
jgi:DNA mismatch repair ATPase MutS